MYWLYFYHTEYKDYERPFGKTWTGFSYSLQCTGTIKAYFQSRHRQILIINEARNLVEFASSLGVAVPVVHVRNAMSAVVTASPLWLIKPVTYRVCPTPSDMPGFYPTVLLTTHKG